MSLTGEITIDEKKYERYKVLVQRITKTALVLEKRKHAKISIHLIKNKKMQEINKKHRKRDAVTNVLSFVEPKYIPHPELKRREEFLGEVYLAPQFIEEKGEDLGFLLIHGILHLLGYTHGERHDKIEMERKEKEMINFLNHDK